MAFWKVLTILALLLGLGMMAMGDLIIGLIVFIIALVVLITSAMWGNAKAMDDWMSER